VRYVYNHFLEEKIRQYRDTGKSDHYPQQAACLTQLKRQQETCWLKEVNSQALQASLRHLDTAFMRFYQGKARFPRFKSKHKKNSFTVPQFVKVSAGKVSFPKFKEGIRLTTHRPLQGVIRHCTVSKTPTGKFFVSILCQVVHTPSKPTHKAVGIDLGLKDFAVASEGIRFKNPHYFTHYASQLSRAQRHLSRKGKGSKGRNRQRLKVAAIHEKISNTRIDLLHKVSTRITNGYDIICVEDLYVKGMMGNRKLAKHIGDASWGTFVRFLQYKADWNDKQVVKIDRFYPSSKTCHVCGYVHQDLTLSERTWICPNGHVLDRDLNASKNILKQGLTILSSGTGDYTDGGSGKTSKKKHKPVKSEAHGSLVHG
jgi:putative transposase